MSTNGSEHEIALEKLLSREKFSQIFCVLRDAVSTANKLPSRKQLQFLRTVSEHVKKDSDLVSKDIVSFITKISSCYAVTLNGFESSDSSAADSLSSLDVKDSVCNKITDTTEESLDYFNRALDSARGIQNADVPISGGLGPDVAVKLGLMKVGLKQPVDLNVSKPQVHFPDYPIDNSDTPFIPPYQAPEMAAAKTKGAKSVKDGIVSSYLKDLYKSNSTTENNVPHPYEDEISAAVDQMSQRPFDSSETTVYRSLDDTPFTFITTEKQLFDAVERIKTVSEISVDLENHSIRSFQGFTCLMQISTRREDFVIDTLSLRGHMHRALASVFADEATVKVLHGANYDIQWLERDFGIYVINMFDTGQAARLLNFASASLSYLLNKYCSVKSLLKKKFQLADWRVRPLPKDMLAYARDDTHYLLYIYDRLRDELSRAGILAKAWEQSGAICRRRHAKIKYNATMGRELAARYGLGFDRHQMYLLETLIKWRDTTARNEDESLNYVAPLSVLFGIVRAKEKARSVKGLLQYVFPGGIVLPVIEKHAEELVRLVCDVLNLNLDDRHSIEGIEKGDNANRSTHTNIAKHMEAAQPSAKAHSSMSKLTVIPIAAKTTASSPPEDGPPQDKTNFFDATSNSVDDQKLTHKPKQVLRKKTSMLLGSDSESSLSTNSKISVEQEDSVSVKPKACGNSEVLNCEPKMCHMTGSEKNTKVTTTQTKHSNKEHENSLRKTVSRVQKEFSEGVRAIVDAGKRFQNEMNPENDSISVPPHIEASATKAENADATTVTEKPIMSILERYGRSHQPLKRKLESGKSVSVESCHIEPFDYEQAIRDDSKREEGDTNGPIDPMRKLKPNWTADRKSKVKKRKRGPGRSMTFKNNN